jgi:hypothetical protein
VQNCSSLQGSARLCAKSSMLVRSYNFDQNDPANFNGDDLSDLSDEFVDDAGGDDVETLLVESLALDDITYDRDLKRINLPNGARPKPRILSGNRSLRLAQDITKDGSEVLDNLDQRYSSLEEKNRVQQRRALVEFDDTPSHRRRDVREERRGKRVEEGHGRPKRIQAREENIRRDSRDGQNGVAANGEHADGSGDEVPRRGNREPGRGEGRRGRGDSSRKERKGRGHDNVNCHNAVDHDAGPEARSGRGRGGRGQARREGGAGRTKFTVQNGAPGDEHEHEHHLEGEHVYHKGYSGGYPEGAYYPDNVYGAVAVDGEVGYGLGYPARTAPRLSDRFAGKLTGHSNAGRQHRSRKAEWNQGGSGAPNVTDYGEQVQHYGAPHYQQHGDGLPELSLRYDAPAFTPGNVGGPVGHPTNYPTASARSAREFNHSTAAERVQADARLNPKATEFVPTFSTG